MIILFINISFLYLQIVVFSIIRNRIDYNIIFDNSCYRETFNSRSIFR